MEWITGFINSTGYGAILFLMFIENIFPPLPSEIIMPLSGFTVSRGELHFIGVVIAGMSGSVLGALPFYYLGRWVGYERLCNWADRHERWTTVTALDLERSRRWFDRYGGKAVFFCRFIPGIRSLISIPAGICRMNMALFLFYTMLGTGIWAALLAYAGYQLGENYTVVGHYIDPVSYLVLGGLVLLYLIRLFRHGGKKGEPARRA